MRNLRENPHAVLHLEAGEGGEHLTVLQGTATLSERPTADWLGELGERYEQKYATGLAGLGLTLADAVARSLGATLVLSPRDGGGLVARLAFPSRPAGGLGMPRD